VTSTRRPVLTQEQIIVGALAIARRDGLAALSMRALAAELQVTPMAAYYWVKDKQTLLALVAEQICSEVGLPGRQGSWDVRLAEVQRAFRGALSGCPGMANYLLNSPVPPSGARIARAALDLLQEAGLTRQDAGRVVQALEGFLLGRLAVESARLRADPGAQTQASLDAEFEFGLGLLLDGVRQRVRS
jgi:AcrR family transcriptional regulator